MNKKIFGLLSVLMLAGGMTGCKGDFLNTQPSTSLSDKTLSESASGVNGVMNGIHNMFYMYNFGHRFGSGAQALGTQLDFLGNANVNSLPAIYMPVYRWTDHRDPNGSINYKAWDYMYTIIQHCNTLLQMTAEPGEMDPKVHKALRGEAKVIRAYCYNYLTVLFGKRYDKGGDNSSLGVILRLEPTIDPMARSTVAECYTQIVKDLEEGISELEAGAVQTRKNRITLPTAYGIAARIYMTMHDYAKAESYAAKAISTFKGRLQTGDELVDGFNDSNAVEWMWGYTQAGDQNNFYVNYGANYTYNFAGYNNSLKFAVNRSYYDKMGEKDVRRKWFVALDRGDKIPADADPDYFAEGDWETTGQCIKYRTKSSSSTMMDNLLMRLGEMYYIKAEAQVRQGNTSGAAETLATVMKTRDPEYVVNAALSADDLAKEILRNKRIDMYWEGQEFFDMKRLAEIPNRISAGNDTYMEDKDKATFVARNSGDNVKGLPKSANDLAWEFLIPYEELVGNKLCKQNPQ